MLAVVVVFITAATATFQGAPFASSATAFSFFAADSVETTTRHLSDTTPCGSSSASCPQKNA
ncbi:hypothetical protein CMV30_06150 [Nibricoccus aquaticus]|uniref:Secreted protein n=1 Tax=Nibricoccus aquaticus TaxID=2576891 RepID=A0A290Q4H6_9BACT|nr:hypothetical protein CMV30_06150 [Nibricoccus aquaticus]